MNSTDQLLDEIQQIKSQYESEVSTARRTWPKSIKEKVLFLWRSGVGTQIIHQRTHIPRATIELWVRHTKKQREQLAGSEAKLRLTEPLAGTFKQMPVVTVGLPCSTEAQTWVVCLPGGIRIEGMDLGAVVELSRRLSS